MPPEQEDPTEDKKALAYFRLHTPFLQVSAKRKK